MARATHLTIATGDRIRLSFPAASADGKDDHHKSGPGDKAEDGTEIHQEVQVSITYALDPEDTDLAVLAAQKAEEVQNAHQAAWHRIGAFASQCSPAGSSGSRSCRRNANGDGNYVAAPNSEQPHMRKRDELRPLSGTTSANVPAGRFVPQAEGPAEPTRIGFPQNGKPGSVQNGVNGSYAAPAGPEMASKPQKILIRAKAHKVGLTTAGLEEVLWKQYRLRSAERLSKAQAAAVIQGLERYERTGRIELIDPDPADTSPEEDTTEEDANEAMEDALSDDDWEPQDADIPHYT